MRLRAVNKQQPNIIHIMDANSSQGPLQGGGSIVHFISIIYLVKFVWRRSGLGAGSVFGAGAQS